MGKLTEEQKQQRDAEQAVRAKKVEEKKRRMPNIVLCVKDPVSNTYEPARTDIDTVCSENDGLVNRADCAKFLAQHKMIGTFYPVRVLRAITREEQTVIKTVM